MIIVGSLKYDILKQKLERGELRALCIGEIDPTALLEQIHLKSNLIRCYPVPFGVGFSFVIQNFVILLLENIF